MMVDSLEMKEADRALIVQNCLQSEEDRIVITHARHHDGDGGGDRARCSGKTVVLTGAMIPYPLAVPTPLQLGSALVVRAGIAPGVYIAMNGKCFPGTGPEKPRARRIRRNFVELTGLELKGAELTFYTSIVREIKGKPPT